MRCIDQDGLEKISYGPPYWIRHFEFSKLSKNDFRFVISDPKNSHEHYRQNLIGKYKWMALFIVSGWNSVGKNKSWSAILDPQFSSFKNVKKWLQIRDQWLQTPCMSIIVEICLKNSNNGPSYWICDFKFSKFWKSHFEFMPVRNLSRTTGIAERQLRCESRSEVHSEARSESRSKSRCQKVVAMQKE